MGEFLAFYAGGGLVFATLSGADSALRRSLGWIPVVIVTGFLFWPGLLLLDLAIAFSSKSEVTRG